MRPRRFRSGSSTCSAGRSWNRTKLAVLTALTNEMISGSNAEAMVRDALTQSAALALDAALLDANASTTARPAGLRYGIAALTASALTDRTEAMLADIATVAGGRCSGRWQYADCPHRQPGARDDAAPALAA